METKNYVVYHLHSDLSLLDSCTKFEDYIMMAASLGQKAICFTEHGNIMRWVAKKEACDKAGIKYLHGCEVYLTAQLEPKVRDNYHTVLIAKNMDGLRELNQLISTSNTDSHFYFKPRISFEEFLNISDNVIKISACLASPLARIENEIYTLGSRKDITPEEQERFVNMSVFDEIKGNDNTRKAWMGTIYESYLIALGYKYNGWR